MAYRSKHNAGVKDPSSVTSSMFHIASLSSASSNGLFTYPPATSSGPTFSTSKRRLSSRQIDNGSVLDLVEAMKDSSPPRVRCSSLDSLNDKSCKVTRDMQYRAWMVSILSTQIVVWFQKFMYIINCWRVFHIDCNESNKI